MIMCEKSIKLIEELSSVVQRLSDAQFKFEAQSKARDTIIDSKLEDRNKARDELSKTIKEGFHSLHERLDKQEQKIAENKSYIDKALGVIGFVGFVGFSSIIAIFKSN